MESDPRLKLHFGKIISQLRSEKSVSQKIVADNCNLERAYISRLERGLSEPSIGVLFILAEYFELSPGELITLVYNLNKKQKK